jgi:hypothetical protein
MRNISYTPIETDDLGPDPGMSGIRNGYVTVATLDVKRVVPTLELLQRLLPGGKRGGTVTILATGHRDDEFAVSGVPAMVIEVKMTNLDGDPADMFAQYLGMVSAVLQSTRSIKSQLDAAAELHRASTRSYY